MSKARKMSTDKLINALVADMVAEGAKKPLPHPLKQLALWLVFTAVAFLLVIATYSGFRADIAQKLAEPVYILELALLFLMAHSAAFAALCLSRPDCHQMPRIRYIPFGFLFFWAITAFAGASNISWTNICYTVSLGQVDCLWHILLVSALPGIAMFLMIRKGAPIECCWAGTMATWSVTSLAYLYMRLIEMTDNPLHLIVWHALPIVTMCMLGMIAGKYFLRWR